MKIIYIILFLCVFIIRSFGQVRHPRDGVYTYSVAFSEWNGKSLRTTCTVIIKGDSVKVLHNGDKNLTSKRGDILDEGVIMKHAGTGKWIIARNARDRYAKEIGDCSDGPSMIDFKHKRWWTC